MENNLSEHFSQVGHRADSARRRRVGF
jgi:hypothetical protein